MIDLKGINSFIFSGGEVHVNCSDVEVHETLKIYAELETSDDIMKLLLTANALKVMGVRQVHAYIPYLPYARQDRACNFGDAFSLDVFLRMIKASDVDSVTTLDVHSEVAISLYDLHVIPQWEILSENDVASYDVLVSPDAGALRKTEQASCKFNVPMARATKVRDKEGFVTTGEVQGDVKGKRCLIIDDICDGGATFIGLANKLKALGASSVGLWVTHGIFSKRREHLLENGLDEVNSASYRKVLS